MKKILIATRNAHKVQEIRAILGTQFQFLTLNDFPNAPKVIEDKDIFAGNAAKKAEELAKWVAAKENAPDFVLADDSGLEVDALNGAPGVHSARFAAMDATENAPDADNNSKLLRLLKDVPIEKRQARFRCVIALTPIAPKKVENASPVCYAEEPEQTQLFDGTCEGIILFEPRGKNGFGYDPLFVPEFFAETFAELLEDIKNKISHRSRALEKLKLFFTNYICVKWIHSFPDEPVWLYSEIDADRREIRKVEIFADGRYGYASIIESGGETRLGELPVPPLIEIANDPQFEPVEITKEKFEEVWQRRKLE
ncbi:MAG TPA: non-canonical purine NTP pyrophosphatase [Pseudomonadales bacterium]|nr:non-canonical purine NTP pyrophosphatase [Pseudomonadales bacterium]